MLNTEALRTKPRVCRGEGQTNYKRVLAYRRLGIDRKRRPMLPVIGRPA